MINQHKINMAIDERIDRIDAFYKKRIDKLQDNNIYLDKKIRELEAQERAHTAILEITSDEIEELQSAQEEREAKASQDVINAVISDFLSDIKALLNNNTQTIKSDNKTRFVNVHNVELIVDRYINNNDNSSK